MIGCFCLMTTVYLDPVNAFGNPHDLPCGEIGKNHLVKTPTSGSLGNRDGNPTKVQIGLCERSILRGNELSIIEKMEETTC